MPGGTDTQPFSLATSWMYSFDVAQVTKVRAASCLLRRGGDREVPAPQPGRAALEAAGRHRREADLVGDLDCFLSYSRPPATVASIHMPQWPLANSARFSLKPLEVAPGGPSAFRMSS